MPGHCQLWQEAMPNGMRQGADMSGHTLGPIEEFFPVDGYFALVFRPDGQLLAKAFNPKDAYLIAAAPEMYAELKAIQESWGYGYSTVHRKEIEKVISKAEGRT
jgi:hypothetical protein